MTNLSSLSKAQLLGKASFAALFDEPSDRFYSGPEISEESGE